MEFRTAENKRECDCPQLVGDVLKMTDVLGFKVPHLHSQGFTAQLGLADFLDLDNSSCVSTWDDHEFTLDSLVLALAVECSWLQRGYKQVPRIITADNGDG